MRSTFFVAALSVLALSACTTVPGAINDANRVGAAAVNSAVSVGSAAIRGAANAVHNATNDVVTTTDTVGSALVPPPVPYYR